MSFASFDLAQKGLSLYTIPAVWVLSMVPHAYASVSAGKNHDNAYPRGMPESLTKDQSIDKRTKQRILRAQAAETNTLETLGFLAGGIIAANAAGVDVQTTNVISFGLLAIRALYIYTYVVLQDGREHLGTLRSLFWTTKQIGIVSLYVLAAKAYGK